MIFEVVVSVAGSGTTVAKLSWVRGYWPSRRGFCGRLHGVLNCVFEQAVERAQKRFQAGQGVLKCAFGPVGGVGRWAGEGARVT
jgi:hypothetical protein